MTIYDVIAIGSNVVDAFVKTDPNESDLIRIKHGKLPEEELVAYPLGTKIIINHLEFQIGGGGTNTGVAFSRLGLKTAYLGKIGEDENGLKIFNNLKKENIAFIGTLGRMNGYSVILDSVGDDRTILTFKGCNNELTFSEIKKPKLKAKAYYCCSMVGESFKTLAKVAAHAKKQGAMVAFNPSSYLCGDGLKPLQPMLSKTDVLILNNEEAQELAGFGDEKDFAKRLAETGPNIVVITKGAKGAMAYDGKYFYDAKPKPKTIIHETTGAGDAFGSTFFAMLVEKKSIEKAMIAAMINAESVIAHYGAKNILLSKKELDERVAKDTRTVKKTAVKTTKKKVK